MSLLTEIQCSIVRMHVANSLRSFLHLVVLQLGVLLQSAWMCGHLFGRMWTASSESMLRNGRPGPMAALFLGTSIMLLHLHTQQQLLRVYSPHP